MQSYCLECFGEVDEGVDRCPRCGADLGAQDREDFDRKLIRALDHRLADRRILAARALGARRSRAAVPALITAAEAEDPYLAAEAVRALVRIGDSRGMELVRRLARKGPAVARAAARRAMRPENPVGPPGSGAPGR